jgi:ATP phosphoribosyltransferase
MKKQNNKIRIAVQNQGRLREPSLDFLRTLGLKFKDNQRELITMCTNADVEIIYVRNSDIPDYISSDVADYGIVGENVLIEKKSDLKIVKRLGFGLCSLVLAAPKKSKIKNIYDLEDERIATTYSNTLKNFLRKKKINASIVNVQGSVEVCPSVNLSDAICDITQSGATLRENGLKILEKILDSEAILVSKNSFGKSRTLEFEKLLINI